MSNLVTDYGCQTVPGTNQMPLQFSPIWRCNFLHFGLQLLVILLYNKQSIITITSSCHFLLDEDSFQNLVYSFALLFEVAFLQKTIE